MWFSDRGSVGYIYCSLRCSRDLFEIFQLLPSSVDSQIDEILISITEYVYHVLNLISQ
ncbi:MAG: hypothetical protein J07HQW2_01439 [Haloquadratum walsbyi J07HQW2]|uniref:Uncharacterized protein n=1 Tax=Haloquadratum walsbyi J07HQW2 TaxID=1238425 RepID=U1PRM7_9EURY|nr:MAG: hypothetical protein J07HQW2_01439 [Haloquadratum walsbyi J07HQW2]